MCSPIECAQLVLQQPEFRQIWRRVQFAQNYFMDNLKILNLDHDLSAEVERVNDSIGCPNNENYESSESLDYKQVLGSNHNIRINRKGSDYEKCIYSTSVNIKGNQGTKLSVNSEKVEFRYNFFWRK